MYLLITIKLKEQKYHQQWLHTTTQGINMAKLAQVLAVPHSVDPFAVSSSLELSSSGLSVCHSLSNHVSMSVLTVLEQVEDITAVHEAAMSQLENNHIVAITVLQDENDCKIQGKPQTAQQLHSCSSRN